MAHTLVIDRFQAEYLIPASHSAPARIKADLDAVVRGQLPQALMAVLTRWLGGEEGIWLIRRLDLDLTVNVAWESQQLARHWAQNLVQLLAQIRHHAGENAIYFDDAVQYRAHFVVDLAAGQAWQRWYYGPFGGLRALPTSAALRTTLLDDAQEGILTLLTLTPQQLAAVLDAISPADAQRMVEGMSAGAQGSDLVVPLMEVWQAWHTSAHAVHGAHAALQLAFGAGRGGDAAAQAARLRAAAILVALAHFMAGGGGVHAQKLAQAVIHGDVATLFLIVGAAQGEGLQPLLAAPVAWRREVVATLLAKQVSITVLSQPLRSTPFGGVFLLLPMLEKLSVNEEPLAADQQTAADQPTANLLRFLTLVKCCGQGRGARLFYDPLIRDLLGIHPTWTVEAAAHWQAQLSEARLAEILAALHDDELPSRQPSALVIAAVRQQRRMAGLVIDGQTGSWLHALYAGGGGKRGMAKGLAAWLLSHHEDRAIICEDAPLRQFLQEEAELLLEPLPAPHAQVQGRAWIDELPARYSQLAADLAFLQLPAALRDKPAVDLALSLLAQQVLRRFAARLPGFARSSLPYLFANFLDFAATVEEEETRRVVRTSRPPLNMILSMTGICRSSYQLTWLDARPVALFQEEEWR